MVYIAAPRNSPFNQLFLNLTKVPATLINRLLSEKHPLDAWQRLFGPLEAVPTTPSEDEFESL